jgi:transcriptional regulator with XRE-family HTH domain
MSSQGFPNRASEDLKKSPFRNIFTHKCHLTMGYHERLHFRENMPSQKPSAPALTPSASARRLDLARSRKKAGVSLEGIAEETKISLRFLRAIEEEEFDKLPGGIFSTSYLRQYAAAIGYDEAELLAHFERKMNPPASGLKARPNANGNQGFLDRWLKVPAEAQR